MLRKLLKIAVGLFVAALVAGGVLYQFFGLRFVMDGGGMPRPMFVESSAEQAARIERHRAAQRAQSSQVAAPSPETATSETRPPSLPQTAGRQTRRADPVARRVLGPLCLRPYWTDFRGPEARRRVSRGTAAHRLAGQRPQADLEAARRRRLRVVRDRQEPRLHHRAARPERSGRGLRRRHRSRVVDQRVAGGIPRVDGRRWPARDADVVRRTRLRARRDRRVSRAGRREREGDLADQHPLGQRREQPALGHGRPPRSSSTTRSSCCRAGRRTSRWSAYDRATGKRLWSAMGDTQAYSSPMLVTLLGVPQIVFFSASRLVGLSADGSRESVGVSVAGDRTGSTRLSRS